MAARRPRAARPAASATLVDIDDTDAVVAACDDAALVWMESPTNPALEIADIASDRRGRARRRGLRRRRQHLRHSPAPAAARRSAPTSSCTPRPSTSPATATSCSARVVTRDDELYGVLKGRRDLIGAMPGTLEAWLALRGLRTLHLRVERAQANAQASWCAGCGSTRRSPRCATPASAASSRSCSPRASWPPTCWSARRSCGCTRRRLGGVESTFERRRRWKTEAPTIPEALVRMSVGIEDVEDLWDDLSRALDGVTA